MPTIIFDGKIATSRRHQAIKEQVRKFHEQGRSVELASIFFTEDEGSVLYTRLKHRAAENAGMVFYEYQFSIAPGDTAEVTKTLQFLQADPNLTGIIIQKVKLTKSPKGKKFDGTKKSISKNTYFVLKDGYAWLARHTIAH